MKCFVNLLPLIAAIILLSGCDSKKFFDPNVVYTGTIISSKSTLGVQAAAKEKNGMIEVVVEEKWPAADQKWNFSVETLLGKKMAVSGDIFENEKIDLTPEKDATELCYHAQTSKFGKIALCTQTGLVSLSIEKTKDGAHFFLSLSPVNADRTVKIEKSRAFSVEEIKKTTLEKNFDIAVEYQHVLQAKYIAKNAALNLVSHISVTSVAGLFDGSVGAYIGSIGDLVPFLLPNRWAQASKNHYYREAEKDVYVILKADSVSIAEGMALVYLRDKKILDVISQKIDFSQKVINEVKSREVLGQIMPGTSDDLTSILNSMIQIKKALAYLQQVERVALSQIMGFENPDAVSDVTSDFDYLNPVPAAIDRDLVMKQALERSRELTQLDNLTLAAKALKTERLFTWMDPAGDPTGGVGLGMVPYVRVASSQIEELKIKREQMKATVLQKTDLALLEMDQSIEQFNHMKQTSVVQKRRIDRILQQLALGTGFDVNSLILALQDQVGTSMNQVAYAFEYSQTKARLNRILFSEDYSSRFLQ